LLRRWLRRRSVCGPVFSSFVGFVVVFFVCSVVGSENIFRRTRDWCCQDAVGAAAGAAGGARVTGFVDGFVVAPAAQQIWFLGV
jgi:hypothetical protein